MLNDMSPKSSRPDRSLEEHAEDQFVVAFDRYLPAMLRLTRGSAEDLVEACAGMPPRTSDDVGEALRVALFRSVVEYTRQEPSPAPLLTAVEPKLWLGGSRAGGMSLRCTRGPLRKPVFESAASESNVRLMLPQAIYDLRPAVR